MRFHGPVGYAHDNVESFPGSGVWVDKVVEKNLYGNVTRNTRGIDTGDQVNPDVNVSNSISVVADAYAMEHFFKIRYVRWAGVLWNVTSVEVQSPRLILSLGSVYNGPTP